jgi:hypothetical protein
MDRNLFSGLDNSLRPDPHTLAGGISGGIGLAGMIEVASKVLAVFPIQGMGLVENHQVAIVGFLRGFGIGDARARIFEDASLRVDVLESKQAQTRRAALDHILLFFHRDCQGNG